VSQQDDNKALVRRYFEAIDAGDPACIEAFLAPDYIEHAPPHPGLPAGIEGARVGFQRSLDTFTNFVHVIDDQIAEDDRVVTRATASGDHIGPYHGIPASGRRVSIEGIAIHRIANGKIEEHWGKIDLAGLMRQMGAIT
jgi:steroid delta-isomerase-like uncharacterized protein